MIKQSFNINDENIRNGYNIIQIISPEQIVEKFIRSDKDEKKK